MSVLRELLGGDSYDLPCAQGIGHRDEERASETRVDCSECVKLVCARLGGRQQIETGPSVQNFDQRLERLLCPPDACHVVAAQSTLPNLPFQGFLFNLEGPQRTLYGTGWASPAKSCATTLSTLIVLPYTAAALVDA